MVFKNKKAGTFCNGFYSFYFCGLFRLILKGKGK
jgi:hypothetical protein